MTQDKAAQTVERVAVAIYQNYAGPDARWECVEPRYQETIWRNHARAALAALPSTDEIRAKALEEAAKVAEGFEDPSRDWLPRSVWDAIKRDTAARIRALSGES